MTNLDGASRRLRLQIATSKMPRRTPRRLAPQLRLPRSHQPLAPSAAERRGRERHVDQLILLAGMHLWRTWSRTRALGSSRVTERAGVVRENPLQPCAHENPCAHVARLFLGPHDGAGARIALEDGANFYFRE